MTMRVTRELLASRLRHVADGGDWEALQVWARQGLTSDTEWDDVLDGESLCRAVFQAVVAMPRPEDDVIGELVRLAESLQCQHHTAMADLKQLPSGGA